MRGFFHKFPKNVLDCFRGNNLFWHFLAIALTYAIVTSGFDWFYFTRTRIPILRAFLFPAVILGGFVPLFGILIFFAVSAVRKNKKAIYGTVAEYPFNPLEKRPHF